MSVLSAKTEQYLRDRAFHTGAVERWISFVGSKDARVRGVRKDFCGFADVIAFGHGRILAIQVCGAGGIKDHMAKIVGNKAALEWARNGGELWLVSWRKLKGETARLHWAPRFFVALMDEQTRDKLSFQEVSDICKTIA